MGYRTLMERIDLEFYVDTYGNIIKYQPYFEPVEVVLSDGNSFTKYDENDNPFKHPSLHSEILCQYIGDEKFYVEKVDNTDVLEIDMGWIAVGKCCYVNPISYKKPTQSQINTMLDLGYAKIKEDFFYGTDKSYWEFRK